MARYGSTCANIRVWRCIALLLVSEKNLGAVLVAAAWVQMPTESEAAAFRTLVDRFGSGNITELSRETRRYRGVRFTGRVYRSWLDGTVVGNAQAEPMAPGTAGRLLTKVADLLTD